MKGRPQLSLNLKSSIIVLDTLSLAASRLDSYFYIRYKNKLSRSIPWDAPAELVKFTLEQMTSVIGSVCVSRSRSLVSYMSGGFRWAIRFEGLMDDFNIGGFEVEAAKVSFDQEGMKIEQSFLLTNEPLQGWVQDSGDDSMCTARYASYKSGSESEKLHFIYTVLPGDMSSALDLSSRNQYIIHMMSEIDQISNTVYRGISSLISAELSAKNMTISSKNIIEIDTSAPVVQSVRTIDTASFNQTYMAGDSLYFEIEFNKPIAVSRNKN